jgi:Copper amine oxidase N-terminal domain.
VKNIVYCLIVVMSLLSFTLPLQAADETHLYINSEKVNTDAAPVLINGRMLVALASLKKLNLDLQWNEETKQVTVASPQTGHTLVLAVGSKTAKLGDTTMMLDVPARAINGRVYVPVRFVSEAFQADVKWIPEIRSVVIRSADKKAMYEALYHGDDLAEARKIAVFLPTENENTLGSTGELHSHTLIFPEGEALRYYHVWGNLYSYYEIRHDVKRLVWEGVEGDEPGQYDPERGTRPPEDKSRVHFWLDRFQSDVVHYRKDGDGEIHYGNSAQPGKFVDSYLSNAVIPIPDEVRIDQVK